MIGNIYSIRIKWAPTDSRFSMGENNMYGPADKPIKLYSLTTTFMILGRNQGWQRFWNFEFYSNSPIFEKLYIFKRYKRLFIDLLTCLLLRYF